MMEDNVDKKKGRKRKLIKFAFSVLSSLVLLYIVVALISGRRPDFTRIFSLLGGREAVEMAGEYNFDVGRNRVFADLDGTLVSAGTLGIQVFDAGGSEAYRSSFRMTEPAISAQNGRAVAYDIGGTAARVFGKTDIIASIDTDGAIVSATINRNGWVAVCTQEGGLTKGVITAYNSDGKAVYKVSLATGYALSAALSPDNKSLAILNLTEDGSRISYYSLNSEVIDRAFDLPGGLILDIRYLTGGDVLAISSDSLFIVSRNNRADTLYEFADKRLGGYSLDGGIMALWLLDYSVGYRGRIVALDEKGNILGDIDTDREIISISCDESYLAILRSDGIAIYDRMFEEMMLSEEPATVAAAGATKVLALRDGSALAAGDNSAIVFTVLSTIN